MPRRCCIRLAVPWILLALAALVSSPSATARQAPGFFRAEGQAIVDPDGRPVELRGVGLGGWLMPEGYMLHISAPDGGSPRSIRARIEDLIGPADTDVFFEKFRANYVEEKDIAAIKAWGFDHIRLPFHYDLFFDPATEAFREEGFALLDTFLSWCRAHGLYVILDMHAAPGAQNALNISDSDGVARLWTEPVPYQDWTVAIWAEIARRYADEPLIIGYDLINEPVTPDGVTGFDLRALYERIADSVRTVDANHILFIEGNFFATHFPELVPPFDDNMIYAFHKYWNGTGLNSIQYLLNLRTDTNVPLWLGETGENSNPWFHAVVKLMDAHDIGWNWWTHKKIETTTSPLSAPFAPGYKAVVDYWRGAGPRPTAEAARAGLLAMAEGLDLDSCTVRRGVLAALFDTDFGTLREPFAEHRIPGVVHAVDYDLGNHGTTYSDRDVMATTGSPGGGNNGGAYRNDGVDIEASTDPQGFAYNVGWMEPFEWMTYTVDIETAGLYDVEIRVASAVGGGRFTLQLDDVPLGEALSVGNTGGWQNWISVWLRGVALPAGRHLLKLSVSARSDAFNVNQMTFTLFEATPVEPDPEPPMRARLLGVYPNPVTHVARVVFTSDRPVRARLEVFDMLGRRVHYGPWSFFLEGEHTLLERPMLAPGPHVYRLALADGHGLRYFAGKLMVVR